MTRKKTISKDTQYIPAEAKPKMSKKDLIEAIKKRNLTPRVLFTKDGKMNSLAGKYSGLAIKEARKEILNDLENESLLLARKPIKHAVNVHDKCGCEVEFIPTKQWFIRILDKKKKFIVYCFSFIVSASGNCWLKKEGLSFMVYGLSSTLNFVSYLIKVFKECFFIHF